MCTPTTLVQNGVCRIDRCSCGNFHVTVGPVTMRVEESVFSCVVDAMQRADLHLSLGRAVHNRLHREPEEN